MKQIIARNFRSFWKISNLIFMAIGIGFVVALSLHLYGKDTIYSFEETVGRYNVDYLTMCAYVFIFGIANISLIIKTADTFTNEIKSGTVKLLFIKPLSRKEILFSKVLGNFLGSLSNLLFCLLMASSLYIAIGNLDIDVAINIYTINIAIFLGGVIEILTILALMSMLAIFIKNNVLFTMLMIFILFIGAGVIPVAENIASNTYYDLHLYCFDLSSQLFTLIKTFAEPLNTVIGTYSGTFSTFMMTTYSLNDPDFIIGNNFGTAFKDQISPLIIMAVYLAITVFSMLASILRYDNMDIS